LHYVHIEEVLSGVELYWGAATSVLHLMELFYGGVGGIMARWWSEVVVVEKGVLLLESPYFN